MQLQVESRQTSRSGTWDIGTPAGGHGPAKCRPVRQQDAQGGSESGSRRLGLQETGLMMRSLLAVLIVLVRSLHLALDSRLGQTMRCPTRRQAGATRPSYDHPQKRTTDTHNKGMERYMGVVVTSPFPCTRTAMRTRSHRGMHANSLSHAHAHTHAHGHLNTSTHLRKGPH